MAEKKEEQSRLPVKLWLPPAITFVVDISTLIYTVLFVLGVAGKIPLELLLGNLAAVVLPIMPYFLVLLVLVIVVFSIATYFLMKPIVSIYYKKIEIGSPEKVTEKAYKEKSKLEQIKAVKGAELLKEEDIKEEDIKEEDIKEEEDILNDSIIIQGNIEQKVVEDAAEVEVNEAYKLFTTYTNRHDESNAEWGIFECLNLKALVGDNAQDEEEKVGLNRWLKTEEGEKYAQYKEKIFRKVVVGRISIQFYRDCKNGNLDLNSKLEDKEYFDEWITDLHQSSGFGPYMEYYKSEDIINYFKDNDDPNIKSVNVSSST